VGASFVRANGLRFAALRWGPADGPLALLLHGFPDHAHTWRHLGPALAEQGWRVVAPWMRGYAPTEVPDQRTTSPDVLAADANALHRALGADGRALLVGHDWGAVAAYRAAAAAPGRWARVVTMAVPPEPAWRGVYTDARQGWRSRYVVAMQLPGAARRVAGLIDDVWREWSPGYMRQPADIDPLRATFTSPGTPEAAVGYYRGLAREALAGRWPGTALPPQPTLYLHGARDGCVGIDRARLAQACVSATFRMQVLDDVGHFLHLEAPGPVGEAVLAHARRSAT
jgi:pimeloyl-ACP methyl ester carboxylesterase